MQSLRHLGGQDPWKTDTTNCSYLEIQQITAPLGTVRQCIEVPAKNIRRIVDHFAIDADV